MNSKAITRAIYLDSVLLLRNALEGLNVATVIDDSHRLVEKTGKESRYSISGYNVLHLAAAHCAKKCFAYILKLNTFDVEITWKAASIEYDEFCVESERNNSKSFAPIAWAKWGSKSLCTPVSLLIQLDEPEMLEALLSAISCPEKRKIAAMHELSVNEVNGISPLNWLNASFSPMPLDLAAWLDRMQCARILLKHGAEVLDGERSALYQYKYRILLSARSPEMAKLLLEHGAIVHSYMLTLSHAALSHAGHNCDSNQTDFYYNLETFKFLLETCADIGGDNLLWSIAMIMAQANRNGASKTRQEMIAYAEVVRAHVGDDEFTRMARKDFGDRYTYWYANDFDVMSYWIKYISIDFDNFKAMIEELARNASNECVSSADFSAPPMDDGTICPRTMQLLVTRDPPVFTWPQWYELALSLLHMRPGAKNLAISQISHAACDTKPIECVARAFHTIVVECARHHPIPSNFYWTQIMNCSVAANMFFEPFVMAQAKVGVQEVALPANWSLLHTLGQLDFLKTLYEPLYLDGLFAILSGWPAVPVSWSEPFRVLSSIHDDVTTAFRSNDIHEDSQNLIMSFLHDSSSHYSIDLLNKQH